MPKLGKGPPNDVPDARTRGEMVRRFVRMGYRGVDLADIISPGRTRRQISNDLIAMQRVAPKGDNA